MGEGLLLRHVVAHHFELLFVQHHDQMSKLTSRQRREPLVVRSSVERAAATSDIDC